MARSQLNSGQPKCKLTVTRGTLSVSAQPGVNKVPFQGRISRTKKLPAGVYTLMITATSSGGRRSAANSLSFAILT